MRIGIVGLFEIGSVLYISGWSPGVSTGETNLPSGELPNTCAGGGGGRGGVERSRALGRAHAEAPNEGVAGGGF